MRFVIFVEGHTEKLAVPSFLKRWLDARLDERVGVKPVRFDGWPEYERDIERKVRLHLTGEKGSDVIAAVGLLDLYGPTFYPPGTTTADDRYLWAKKHIETKVGDARFSQHFAVHELEAWLLSQPDILPAAVKKALPGRCREPETVNFGEPPGKLLARLYQEKTKRSYKKTIDGYNLFRALDPSVAAEKCPSLKKLLEDMLKRAKKAGL